MVRIHQKSNFRWDNLFHQMIFKALTIRTHWNHAILPFEHTLSICSRYSPRKQHVRYFTSAPGTAKAQRCLFCLQLPGELTYHSHTLCGTLGDLLFRGSGHDCIETAQSEVSRFPRPGLEPREAQLRCFAFNNWAIGAVEFGCHFGGLRSSSTIVTWPRSELHFASAWNRALQCCTPIIFSADVVSCI